VPAWWPKRNPQPAYGDRFNVRHIRLDDYAGTKPAIFRLPEGAFYQLIMLYYVTTWDITGSNSLSELIIRHAGRAILRWRSAPLSQMTRTLSWAVGINEPIWDNLNVIHALSLPNHLYLTFEHTIEISESVAGTNWQVLEPTFTVKEWPYNKPS